jgi:hypothetical protein
MKNILRKILWLYACKIQIRLEQTYLLSGDITILIIGIYYRADCLEILSYWLSRNITVLIIRRYYLIDYRDILPYWLSGYITILVIGKSVITRNLDYFEEIWCWHQIYWGKLFFPKEYFTHSLISCYTSRNWGIQGCHVLVNTVCNTSNWTCVRSDFVSNHLLFPRRNRLLVHFSGSLATARVTTN